MKSIKLLFIGICVCLFFNFCNSDNSILGKSDIEVIWSVDYHQKIEEEFSGELQPFFSPIIVGEYVYVRTNRPFHKPVLFKFRKDNGELVDTWDEGGSTGFHHGNRRKYYHVYDNKLFIVSAAVGLIVIDLNTMTTSWTLEFQYGVNPFFEAIGNKIYLGLVGDNENQIIEVDLDIRNYRTIYQISMPNQGVFGPNTGQHYPYITTSGDTAIIITEMQPNDDFRILNYNITKDEMIYNVIADDLNNASINSLVVHKDKIHLTSSSVVNTGLTNCRKLSDGSRVWTKFIMSNGTSGVFIKNDKLFYGTTEKLYCLNTENGQVLWKKTEEELADFVSQAEFKLYGNLLFCNETAINATNGKIIEEWFLRDEYDVPNYPFLVSPVLDESTGLLYAVGRYEIFCLEMPEID